MAYTIEKKIQTLDEMIQKLNMLVTLIEEEDVEAADQAAEAADVLTVIKKEYEERYDNLYNFTDE